MKYSAPVNAHAVTTETLAKLQPGQWVYAGDRSAMGRFLGVKRSGTVVVAWLGNERSKGSYSARLEYIRNLRNFALGDRI
jgi:hypothetical protein